MDIDRLRAHFTRTIGDSALFATLSGAHLYGFESPDSDVDLRGTFVLPVEQVVGLRTGPETVNRTVRLPPDDLELDLVCHDILKFCRLLVKRSGEVLEQLYSTWVVCDSPLLQELRELVRPLLVRPFYYHYRGFLDNQLRFVDKPEATVKELLYAYRVALTGIHLLRRGQVLAHLPGLLEDYPQAGVSELIELKRNSREHAPLSAELRDRHRPALTRLEAELAEAFASSSLPVEADTDPLHRFIVRVRLGL